MRAFVLAVVLVLTASLLCGCVVVGGHHHHFRYDEPCRY